MSLYDLHLLAQLAILFITGFGLGFAVTALCEGGER